MYIKNTLFVTQMQAMLKSLNCSAIMLILKQFFNGRKGKGIGATNSL